MDLWNGIGNRFVGRGKEGGCILTLRCPGTV